MKWEETMYTILIIEDDVTIRTQLKSLLEKYGYEVVITEDFSNVVEEAIATKPHLILLDLNLPVYDGFHICREIRRQSKIPIVIVTSRDSDMDELMSMNLGADDFITKPYHTQILIARLSAVLNRVYQNGESEMLAFFSLQLDIGKNIVSCNGLTTELTKNEMRILSILMKNNGNIVSRDDIMNELWQSNEFVDDNTLTVNINRLRTKLQEIGAADMLKTKRGQGYLLWN